MTGQSGGTGNPVVIVGTGVAGLSTALELAAVIGPANVILLAKGSVTESNTHEAQGGIAAALGPDDSPALHHRDTLAAEAGLGDWEATRLLCVDGAAVVGELARDGVIAFDRAGDGELALGLEAAHSRARIVHAGGDATGAAIVAGLMRQVRETSIRVVEHVRVLDLATRPAPTPPPLDRVDAGDVAGSGGTVSIVSGVEVMDQAGRVTTIAARAVVLATGGLGQLFTVTTNPAVATGDGIAMAWRAGAELADLEFIQFHPTCFTGQPSTQRTGRLPSERQPARQPATEPFLISEAVRGAGAVLRDSAGRRFMLDVDERAELAPRDVVSRAVSAVIGSGGHVFLDATALENARPGSLRERFPTLAARLAAAGVDWRTQWVPVAPAAHYAMGGVRTDLEGRTSLPGLWAVGEVACTGAQGANRLASNSLLEGLVFSRRAARSIASALAAGLATGTASPSRISGHPVIAWQPPAAPGEPGSPCEGVPGPQPAAVPGRGSAPTTCEIIATVKAIMSADVGVTRDGTGLARAGAQLAVLAQFSEQAANRRGSPACSHHDAAAARQCAATARNLVTVAALVTAASLARPESRGGHFRSDHPQPDPDQATHHVQRHSVRPAHHVKEVA